MRIAICISHKKFKFYDAPNSIIDEFKKKYANKSWRVVDVDGCTTKREAVALCKKTMKERIKRIKYEAGRKRGKGASEKTKDKRAYRLIGSAKQYARIRAKFDATKLVGTRVF